jgi:hypothetical protein
MAGLAELDEFVPSVATRLPTTIQYQSALAFAANVAVVFVILCPFAGTQFERLNSFVPTVETIILVADLSTAILLFSRFGSRALLVLASGYLFSAAIIIPHMLTYPGAFAPTGILGGGLQTTPWLYVFWNLGFPAAVIGYACLKDSKHGSDAARLPHWLAVALSVAVVAGLVCALTLLVTMGEALMPRLFLNEARFTPLAKYVAGMDLAVSMAALLLLWVRRRSVLDLWLMVAVSALLAELATVVFVIPGRFSIGFYLGRIFSLVVSTAVLVALLWEPIRLKTADTRRER